jgi:hypothetical protein
MALIRFDTKRLGIGDVMAGGGCLALAIGVFLPWFEFGSRGTGYFSFDATAVRSWMYLSVVVALVVVDYLLVTAMAGRLRLPVPHRLFLVGACGADLTLTVVCFATKAPGLSWDVGAYVSLVAASVALLGALIRTIEGVVPAPRPVERTVKERRT